MELVALFYLIDEFCQEFEPEWRRQQLTSGLVQRTKPGRMSLSEILIARTAKYVVAWHWVPYESNEYWTELLSLVPAPTYVVCDGQKGMLKAIQTVWPTTVVQRCRFHAWLNVKAKLTLHPETTARQELLDAGNVNSNSGTTNMATTVPKRP